MPRPLSWTVIPLLAGDGHANGVTVSGKGLVNGVVDHLVDQVVQSPCAHISDVHRGTLADVFHALEGLDAVRRHSDASSLRSCSAIFGRLAKIALRLPNSGFSGL